MNQKRIRKTELNLVVGINGTGKTTWLRKNVVDKGKSLVVTPDTSEWRHLPIVSTPEEIRGMKGSARIIYEDTTTLETIQKSFSGGNLVLDDAMAYLNEQTPKIMQYLYIRRRQFGIDLYIVAHGLRQLPPKVFTFTSFLILFNSVENFSERKKELIPEIYDKVIEAQNRIRQKVAKGEPYYGEIILFDLQIKSMYLMDKNNK